MSIEEFSQHSYFRGRVALFAILRALNIKKGDEVATQAFTCVAVPEAIMALGAIPIYIDISEDGFNMDPSDLSSKITSRTRAIIVQHTFGIPANMDAICQIATKAGIPIVEDCCHSLESTYKGIQVGSFGCASFFSYEWGKPIVAGIGGTAMVNDNELLKKLAADYDSFKDPSLTTKLKLEVQYIAHSLLYSPSLYWPVRYLYRTLGGLGVLCGNYNKNTSKEDFEINKLETDNFEIGEFHKAAEDFSLKMVAPVKSRLLRKLQNLRNNSESRKTISEIFRTKIQSSFLRHPTVEQSCEVVYARYPMLCQNKPELVKAACKARVEIAEWYSTVIHPLTANEWHTVRYKKESCPNAETRCAEVVSLPTHSKVSASYLRHSIDFLNSFFVQGQGDAHKSIELKVGNAS